MHSDISVRVVCPECGPVVVPARELRCKLSPTLVSGGDEAQSAGAVKNSTTRRTGPSTVT